MHETQVACFILSADQQNDADTLALLGASVALNVSPVPFNTPVASVRVGRIQGTWVLNPTFEQLEYSDVDIVVAGSESGITMVEGGTIEVDEADVLEGLQVAHEGIKELVALQKEFIAGHTVPDMEWEPKQPDAELTAVVTELASARIAESMNLGDKQERSQALAAVREDVTAELVERDPDYAEHAKDIGEILRTMEKKTMREQILSPGPTRRRPRAGRHSSDFLRGRRAAAPARIVALHPRTDPGTGRRHPGNGSRRAADRLDRLGRGDQEVLHASLQLPAVLGG